MKSATVIGSESGFNYGASLAHTQPTVENKALLQDTTPRNRCCCWCVVGFLSCITLFLLLFFFIPRPPRSKYESSVVTFNPYVVTQTYKITNNNMYSLEMSNLDLQVETLLTSGTSLVGYGTFAGDSSSITIPKNSDKEVSVVYTFDSTASENSEAKQACFSAHGVQYVTSGTVRFASAKYQNFSHGVAFTHILLLLVDGHEDLVNELSQCRLGTLDCDIHLLRFG